MARETKILIQLAVVCCLVGLLVRPPASRIDLAPLLTAVPARHHDRLSIYLSNLHENCEVRNNGTWDEMSGRLVIEVVQTEVNRQRPKLLKSGVIPKQDIVLFIETKSVGILERVKLGTYADQRSPLWQALRSSDGSVVITQENLAQVLRAVFDSDADSVPKHEMK